MKPKQVAPTAVRSQIGTRINQNLSAEVKILAIRQKKRFNDLVEEALIDLLEKYKRSSK